MEENDFVYRTVVVKPRQSKELTKEHMDKIEELHAKYDGCYDKEYDIKIHKLADEYTKKFNDLK